MSSMSSISRLANLHLVEPSRSSITIRHPGALEYLPTELVGDLNSFTIDRNWQWIAIHSGKIVGQILACPMHGILQFIRISTTSDAPKTWVLVALRQVLAEASSRGLVGYTCFLDDRHPMEVKIMRLVERHGGKMIPSSGVWVAGLTVGGEV